MPESTFTGRRQRKRKLNKDRTGGERFDADEEGERSQKLGRSQKEPELNENLKLL